MQSSSELKSVALRLYGAMSQGDTGFAETYFSRQVGALAIGTDPREWWDSYDRMVSAMNAQIREMVGATFVPGDLHAYVQGEVGWIADQGNLQLTDGATLPVRHPAVFTREDGSWRCVQAHFSIGVTNEETVGKELTI